MWYAKWLEFVTITNRKQEQHPNHNLRKEHKIYNNGLIVKFHHSWMPDKYNKSWHVWVFHRVLRFSYTKENNWE